MRSKNVVACSGKFNTIDANELAINDTLTAQNLVVSNDATIGNDLTVAETTTSRVVIDATNVKYYGAVGDGVTDDLAAFNAALADQCLVIVPAGSYYLSDTLTLPVRRRLRGCASAFLRFDNSDADFVCISAQGASEIDNIELLYAGSNVTTSTLIEIAGDNVVLTESGNSNSFRCAYGISMARNHIFVRHCFIYAEISAIVASAPAAYMTVIGNLLVNATANPCVDIQATTSNSGNTFVGNRVVASAGDGFNLDQRVSVFGGRVDASAGTAFTGAQLVNSIVIVEAQDKRLALPTSAPATAGALWNDAGTVKVVP